MLLLPDVLCAQPSWVWAEGVQAGSEQRGYAIATDAAGNSYTTGFFKGTPSFDGNPLSSGGGEDCFIAKYDANGNGIWATSISGNNDDRGFGITLDAAGNIYVCGQMDGSVTLFGSPNIVLNSIGSKDIFIAKYNSSGSVLWAKNAGSTGDDEASAICTDGNAVYITGMFSGTATFGALPQLLSAGGDDIFTAAYSCASGTEQWAVQGGSTAADHGDGIAVDASGVYVSGHYGNATCSFQNHSGSLASSGNSDVFLVKYNLTGTTGLWKRRAGSTGQDEGTCVTLNGSFVYVGGFFQNTISFYNTGPAVATLATAGAHDSFFAQYDASTGNFSWARSESGSGDDRIFGLSGGPNGTVYTTGYWNGTLPFGTGPAVTSGNRDVFVTCYSASGTFLHGMRATGSAEEEGYGVAANSNNEIYVTGYYKSSNTQFGTTPQLNNSSDDVFISKLLCGVTTANAGVDQTLCSATATLNGNTPSAGSGTWTLISGTGTITSPTSPTSGITALGTGANVFRWTISNGGCFSSDEVTITRDVVPTTSNAGNNQQLCSSTATLSGNVPVVGTGLWTLISGTGTITNASSASSGITALGVGANVFQWTITNGTCPSSTDQVTITREAVPTTSAAGTDQTLCSSSSAFAGNTPTTGSGVWTLVSGSGVPSNPTSPTSAVTGLAVGNNIFQWTISNGTCPSSTDQVTITRDPVPTTAAAGPNQTLCSSSSTLAGNAPTIGSGVWTLVSGSGVPSNATSPTSAVTGLAVGANTFQWTITNGTCPSSTDQVTITVDPFPTTANAGADQSVCSSTASLNGNAPVVGSGTWSVIAGGATVTTPSSPTSGVTNLSIGQNTFVWRISNGTCPSSRDTVIIQRDAVPSTAFAGSNQTLCSSTAFLNAVNPSTGNGLWTLVSGSGTIVNPNSDNTTVNGLGTGPNVFQWTVTNGVCPSSSDQVTITVDAIPTVANAGSDQTVCSSTASLSGNTPLTGTGTWSVIAGGATVTTPSSPTSGVTNLSTGQNTFVWRIANGTCPSSRDTVIIQRDAPPSTAYAGFNQTLCSSSAFLNAINPSTGTGLWTLVSGNGTIVNPNSDNTTVNSLGTGANVFQWTVSNGVCPSSTDQVTITVDSMPTTASAGPDQTICSSSATMNANTPLTGSGTWSVISSNGSFTAVNSPTSAVTNLDPGMNVFQWTISNGTCPSSHDTVTIQVDTPPSTASAGPDQTVCGASVLLNANNPQSGNGVWTLISGSGSIANPNSDNTSVSNLGAGANVFQWTISNGVCPSSTDQVTINSDEMPTPANAGSDAVLCASSHQMSGNTPLVGTGVWSVILGGGTFTNALLPTTTVTALPIGLNIFQWTISNGVCPSSSDNVLLTIDLSPTVANAGADRARCSTTDTLTGNIPLVGVGTWSLLSGSGTIQNPSAASSPVTALGVGVNEFTWSISNGVCPASVDTIAITRDDFPSLAVAGVDANTCEATDTMNGNIPQTGIGAWSVISGNGLFSDPAAANAVVSNLGTGQNVFVWTVSSGVCPSEHDTVVITYNEFPSLANAGADILACREQILLQAQTPVIGSGVWHSVNGSPAVADSTNPFTPLPALSAGTWYYEWTTQNGFCISPPDTVAITVYALPDTAIAGDDRTTYVRSVQLSAAPLDTGTGTWTFVQGSGTFENIHDPLTRVSDLAVGENILRWTATNGTCPDNSDDLRIHVLELVVPEGFSPNGDGVNDQFEITGLQEFADPSLSVFNRWGNEVYAARGYGNNWNGTTSNGEQLPDDVYYYVLKADAGTVFTGFIVIKRNAP